MVLHTNEETKIPAYNIQSETRKTIKFESAKNVRIKTLRNGHRSISYTVKIFSLFTIKSGKPLSLYSNGLITRTPL